MTPTLWGLLAGIPAVGLEYYYRTMEGSWFGNLWVILPAQLALSYGIYSLVTQPHVNLVDAVVIFSWSTIFLRVLVTLFVLHDPVSKGTWMALGLLATARVVQMRYGR
jgi:hypothetical protein